MQEPGLVLDGVAFASSPASISLNPSVRGRYHSSSWRMRHDQPKTETTTTYTRGSHWLSKTAPMSLLSKSLQNLVLPSSLSLPDLSNTNSRFISIDLSTARTAKKL